MAAVVFDEDGFRAQFPGLSDEEKYSSELLAMCFDLACDLIGNDAKSLAPYNPDKGVTERERLLYLATCHLATLMGEETDSPVGRVASASQGSVSTSFDLIKTDTASGDWWNQTRCGALVWVMLQKYRWGGRFAVVKKRHPWG